MEYQIPPRIQNLTPYKPVHGRYSIRLDANESGFSLPPELRLGLLTAVSACALNRYPDPYAKELTSAAARNFGVSAEMIVCGNGSDELISLIVGGFCDRNAGLMTLAPDFSMYGFYAEALGIPHVSLPKKDLRVDIDETIAFAREYRPGALIFSNPCNPTGQGIPAREAARLLAGLDCLVVADEAYMDFWGETVIPFIRDYPNLIVLKTASKALGMAAARLGFALSRRELADALKKIKAPYNVSAMSQAAGAYILSDAHFLRTAARIIMEQKTALCRGIDGLIAPWPNFKQINTHTNFALIQTGAAHTIVERLADRGIAVKQVMGDYIRVTAGAPEENAAFLTAFGEIIGETLNP